MSPTTINTAIILAAGKNTRFDTGIPKSLHQIGESTLLERHIREFHRNGVKNVAVITGYRDTLISEYIHGLNPKLAHEVSLIHNDQYEKANGLSIFVAQDWISSMEPAPFICTMSDHVYSSDFYVQAIKAGASIRNVDAVLNLIVDKPGKHNEFIDLEDVTRVWVKEDESGVKQIGNVAKLMDRFNYFDTGFFILHPSVFEHLEYCIANQQYSISDLVNYLSGQGKSQAIDLTGYYWNDVDTPDDFNMVQSQLNLL